MTTIKKIYIFLFSLILTFLSTSKLIKFRKQYNLEDVNPDTVSAFRVKQFEALVLIALAYIIAFIFSNHPTDIPWSNIFPIVILSYAVFAQCGWKIQTWSTDTFIERLDNYWFRFFSFIGLTGTIWSFLK